MRVVYFTQHHVFQSHLFYYRYISSSLGMTNTPLYRYTIILLSIHPLMDTKSDPINLILWIVLQRHFSITKITFPPLDLGPELLGLHHMVVPTLVCWETTMPSSTVYELAANAAPVFWCIFSYSHCIKILFPFLIAWILHHWIWGMFDMQHT